MISGAEVGASLCALMHFSWNQQQNLQQDREQNHKRNRLWIHGLSFMLCALLVSAIPASAQLQAPALQGLGSTVLPAVNLQSLKALGQVSDQERIQLTLVLPLRNQDELMSQIARLYDPNSSEYRKFLSVQEFTERFGPSVADYEAVLAFAQSSGFTVLDRPANRLVIPIAGTAAQVKEAFHVTLNQYQHPTEARSFFAPDAEPTMALSVKLAHIEGLTNYALPQSLLKFRPQGSVQSKTILGSGPSGSYLGSDMRAAYYGGSALTGANQTIAMVQFGSFNQSDVTETFTNAGQSSSVSVVKVLVGTATDSIPNNDAEQVLDIVQAIGMAPGLSQVRVYIGDPYTSGSPLAVLNSIASENKAKVVSCSWGWVTSNIAAHDLILAEMVAQGQSFFTASGDEGAFQLSISPYIYPAESAWATVVGGTNLTTTKAGGAWTGEIAWNSEGNGSGGGVSPHGLGLPSYQKGVATTNNGGSTTLRNSPDVAMEGDFDNYSCYSNSAGSNYCSTSFAGTSFSAPRWAGFMALVNQQAVAAGNAPLGGIGFINPQLYALGTASSTSSDFHDVTSGSNLTNSQTVWYSAVQGYDLVTGFGSPNGQSMINALAGKVSASFWITAQQGTLNVGLGSTASTTINVTDAGSFSDAVNLAVTSTLPSGLTATFSTPSTTTGSTLIIAADKTVATGTYPLTITGTSGSLSESTVVSVIVHQPGFTLGASPIALSLNQNGSATSTLTITPSYGFNNAVNFAVSGLPTGVTATWSQNPATSQSVITLAADTTAIGGTSTLTVTGTSGTATANATLSLTVVTPGISFSYLPSSITMGQGSNTSVYVPLASVNGFVGNVQLSVSGLPAGVTALFSPNPQVFTSSNSYNTSTLSLISASTVATGTSQVKITATSGSLSASSTMSLIIAPPSFTLSTYSTLDVGQGNSSTGYLSLSSLYGFANPVTLSASGLPSGVSVAFTAATLTGSQSTNYTVAASSATVAGTYPITLTGTSGSLSASTTVYVTVAKPDFSLYGSTGFSLAQGGSATGFIYYTSTYGFSNTVIYSVSGLPSGVTGSFTGNQLNLSAASSVAAGNYSLTITGTSGSLSHTLAATLTVAAPTLQVYATSALLLGIGNTTSINASVYGSTGYTGNVTLALSGLPSGVTASIGTNPVAIGSSTQVVFTASGSAVAGSYTVVLTATSGSLSASTNIALTVAVPSFSLSSGGASSISQGGSGNNYILISAINGFTGNVNFIASGAPSGMTVSFTPNPSSYSTTLQIAADASLASGNYTLTITGTSGSITATTTTLVKITAPAFTITPTNYVYSVSLNQSSSSSLSFWAYSTNGYTGSIALDVSGLPTGVTAAFTTNPMSLGINTLVFIASSTTAGGTYPLTITATAGSTTVTTPISLVVNAQAIALMATPAQIQLSLAGSHSTAVSITPLYGFTGSVNLAVSGLPAGVTAAWSQNPATTASTLTLTADSSTAIGTSTATITATAGSVQSDLSLPVVVQPNATTTATQLSVSAGGSSINSVAQGSIVTLTANVTSAGSPVTQGLVKFCRATTSYCSDLNLLGSVQLNMSGVAAISFAPPMGSYNYKAVFAGTTSATTSTSDPATLAVTGANLASATTLTNVTNGSSVTLTSTVSGSASTSPSGSVSLVDTSNGNASVGSVTLGSAQTSLSWNQSATLPAGYYGYAVLRGDVNGDGLMDMTIVNNSAVVQLLGNADGSFTPSSNSPGLSISQNSALLADVNMDGKLDLVAGGQNGAIAVLLGNGDGSFADAKTVLNLGAYMGALVLGDFNSDGIPDLAVAIPNSSAIEILLGNGDGTFTAQPALVLSGFYPGAMIAADLNGDGNIDLAVANAGTSNLMLLLGQGDGSFKTVGSISVGSQVSSLAAGDWNKDGKIDLLTLSYNANTLTVLLGKGDGSFTASASAPSGSYNSGFAVGDLDGDGNVDVVTYGYNPSTLLGQGDGSFASSTAISFAQTPNACAITATGTASTQVLFCTNANTNTLTQLQPAYTHQASGTTGSLTFAAGSTHTLVAKYPGDSVYAASTSPTLTLVGSVAQPNINWTTPSAILYGTALSTAQLNASSSVAGSFSYSPAAGTVLPAGQQTLATTFTPTDTTNYSTATASVVLTVNKTTPTLTWALPTSILYGTALGATQLNATANVAGSFNYSPASGTVPALGTIALSTTFTPTDAANYNTATASVNLNVIQTPAVLHRLSPAIKTAGAAAFTLTIDGSGFTPASVVYWGSTALATQFASTTEVTASVTAASVANAGTGSITVQNPGSGGGTSNTMQLEIDPSTTGAVTISTASATITAGATSSYSIALPTGATNVSVSCLNLPTGAVCSYSSGTLLVSTTTATPSGSWQIIALFTETVPGAASGWLLLPFGLLPFATRKRARNRQVLLGLVLAVAALAMAVGGCGGGGGTTTTNPATHTQASSGVLTLTIQ